MDGVTLKVWHPHQVAKMSRTEALRVLTSAGNVSPAEKHMAELMLAGPEISDEDQARIKASVGLRMPLLRASVRAALG